MLGQDAEVQLVRLAGIERYLALERSITKRCGYYCICTLGNILDKIVTGSIGHHAESSTFKTHIDVSHVLAGSLVGYVTIKVRVGRLIRCVSMGMIVMVMRGCVSLC